jgi:nicotinamide-nucleotide amidase
MSTQINASIITIGDELLIGQTIDTNSAWIGQQLNALGIWLKRRVAVGDSQADILQALDQEAAQSDLIIITGGLGPTADDITKPLLCNYFNGQLVENEKVKNHVLQIFRKRNRPIIATNIAQAMLPNVCDVLWNEMGTAPGMWFVKNNKIFIALPGVPFEMKHIMTHEALPKIKERFTTPNVMHKTICTAGIGESFLAASIQDFETSLPANIKLAYLPQLGGVKLRLTGRDVDAATLENYFQTLITQLPHIVYATEDMPMEKSLGKLLLEKKLTVSFAESCTGGGISAAITSITGSSGYCNGGIVSYTNDVKINSLGVLPETLKQFSAVSAQTVAEMANGVRTKLKSSIGLSISGYLEVVKGKESEKGLIWIGICNQHTSKTISEIMPYDRERNCELAIATALNNLRIFITENY